MRIAIFSDLHDNAAALERILSHGSRHQADGFYYLGDVGHEPALFRRLAALEIPCIFGNWEVSGLRRLPEDLATWVAEWPATMEVEGAILAHATPEMPPGVTTTREARVYMGKAGAWRDLFPRLDRNTAAIWNALAGLEERDQRVVFHGHTHVQLVWNWQTSPDAPTARRTLRAQQNVEELVLAPGREDAPNRYLVGVGSAGQAEDGPQICYAIYDSRAQVVTMHRLPPG